VTDILVIFPALDSGHVASESIECEIWLRRWLPENCRFVSYQSNQQSVADILRRERTDQAVLWLRSVDVVLAPNAVAELFELFQQRLTANQIFVPCFHESYFERYPFYTLSQFESAAAHAANDEPRLKAGTGRRVDVALATADVLLALTPWADDSTAETAADIQVCNRALAFSMIDIYEIDRAEMLEWVPKETKSLLDIGCARGKFGAGVKAMLSIPVWGVEMSLESAAIAKRRLDRVLTGDFLKTNFNQKFDCITALDVFEHLDNFRGFLDKARQSLSPTGCLILSVPNVGFAPIVADLLVGRWDYVPSGSLCITHIRFFTEASLRREVTAAGFNITRVEPVRVALSQEMERFIEQAEAAGFPTNRESLEAISINLVAVPAAADQRSDPQPSLKIASGSLLSAKFAFPLNVYAHLLTLETGGANYLHYGLFRNANDSVADAQERSTEIVWENLPPPCKILEVGIGLGTTLGRLTATGYGATGLTPDPEQISYVRSRLGNALKMRCCRLEEFDELPGTWDALLFQESGQYIDAVDLFAKADELLTETGEILLLDEFAVRRRSPGKDNLHVLSHFLALAERSGFSVVQQIDLSKQAAPTVDWLLNATEKNSGALIEELGVTAEQLTELNTSNRKYQDRYQNGDYGYFLLKLKRSGRPHWRVKRVRHREMNPMRQLFAEVFSHEMNEKLWDWKYGNGRGTAMGVWNDQDTLIAHYGGVSRDILLLGKPQKAMQVGDVMVAASERGTLSRKGPIFLATATFLEQELGYGTSHLLGVGFPNETAYKVAARLNLYAPLGRMQSVTWPARQRLPSLYYRVRELRADDSAADKVMDECWQLMARSLTGHIVGVRDAAYLRHRYIDHPEKEYRIFLVSQRYNRRPLGIIVLRKTDDASCELLDIVGALADVPYMVLQARRVSAQLGAQSMFAWLIDDIVRIFNVSKDAKTEDLKVVIPGNAWTATIENEQAIGKWWLIGGDTDFH